MKTELFDLGLYTEQNDAIELPALPNQKALGQYMTPSWAARLLWEQFFSDITSDDFGWEPTCGDGRFLQAIPKEVPMFASEIDPRLAAIARRRTGRDIWVGDALKAKLPERKFTFVVGNPPFACQFLFDLLELVEEHMDDGRRVALVLPAYFMQTPSTVLRFNRKWTIYPELLPRTLFPRAYLPLIWTIFTKDPMPTFKGLRLYVEAESFQQLKEHAKNSLTKGTGLWKPVVQRALRRLGGRAHLSRIYDEVGRSRPTENEWWQAKVRQTLQRGAGRPLGGGFWEEAA